MEISVTMKLTLPSSVSLT